MNSKFPSIPETFPKIFSWRWTWTSNLTYPRKKVVKTKKKIAKHSEIQVKAWREKKLHFEFGVFTFAFSGCEKNSSAFQTIILFRSVIRKAKWQPQSELPKQLLKFFWALGKCPSIIWLFNCIIDGLWLCSSSAQFWYKRVNFSEIPYNVKLWVKLSFSYQPIRDHIYSRVTRFSWNLIL